MTIQEWKQTTEADIRLNPSKYLNPSLAAAHASDIQDLSAADLGGQIEITFGADDKIQDFMDNKMLDICCLVCIKLPFGLKQCAVPHNGPCNMCG